MLLKRIVVLAVLVAVSTSWAGERESGSRPATKASDDRVKVDRTGDATKPIDLNVSESIDSNGNPIRPNEEDLIILPLVPDEERVATTIPRIPLVKLANNKLVAPVGGGGTLFIKFRDDLRARLVDGRFLSQRGADLSPADLIIRRNGLRVQPMFDLDEMRLLDIEDKVATFSQKAQPDLAGMMKIVGPPGRMAAAARAFNGLDIIEYVEFEPDVRPASMQATAACCIQSAANAPLVCADVSLTDCLALGGQFSPNLTCVDSNSDGLADACVGGCCLGTQAAPLCASFITPLDCTFAGGNFRGGGSACLADGGLVDCDVLGACCVEDQINNITVCFFVDTTDCALLGGSFTAVGIPCTTQGGECEPPQCGDLSAGSCFVPTAVPASQGGTNSPFCDIQDCCTAVCVVYPECCDDSGDTPFGDWNQLCAQLANIFREQGSNSCIGPVPPPFGTCNTSPNNCFNAAASPGCSIFPCCQAVCFEDPDCCDTQWLAGCATFASVLCIDDPSGGTGPTPDFNALGFQGYLNFDPWAPTFNSLHSSIVSSLFPANCIQFIADGSVAEVLGLLQVDLFTSYAPFSGYTGEGFDLNGLENVSLAIFRLGKGTDADGDGIPDESEGLNIRIGVIDDSAFIQNGPDMAIHEDLAGMVTMVPANLTLLPRAIARPDHGTAILGIIGANPSNGLGMVGMAPKSDLYFFPSASLETGGRLGSAMMDTIDTFDRGDVVVIPQHIAFGTLFSGGSSLWWTLGRMIVDSGINLVIPAGNDAADLIGNPQAGNGTTNDSGAIVVGAVTPGFPFSRMGLSNHCSQCDDISGDNVHTAAWGSSVATLGYGDLFGSDPDHDFTDIYTLTFGGTSAAAAQIGALVARYEGIAKQMYDGMPLSPMQIRHDDGNFTQGILHIDFQFNQDFRAPLTPLGQVEDFECIGDTLDTEEPNIVKGFPNATAGAAYIIVGDHFGQSINTLSSVQIIRGKLIFGNKFALDSIDRNYLIVESQYTDRNTRGPGGRGEASSTVTYMASGQIADIIVDADADANGIADTLDVIFTAHNTDSGVSSTNLHITEMFDWSARKFDFVGWNFLSTIDVTYRNAGFFNVSRFIRESDDRIKVRLYTIGLSMSRTTRYQVLWDYVDVDLGAPPPVGNVPGNVE